TEAEGQHLVKFTLTNYIQAIEDGISSQLPGGRYMEMDRWPLLAPSFLTQTQALQLAVGGPFMAADEARDRMALPPRAIAPAPPPAPVIAQGATGGSRYPPPAVRRVAHRRVDGHGAQRRAGQPRDRGHRDAVRRPRPGHQGRPRGDRPGCVPRQRRPLD